jgi:hypothetical protein
MTIERKVGMGIAGQPTGPAADVAEVFSTHLYTGNGSTQTITNGIDLAGEGGMVWIKCRTTGYSHSLHDTERGATKSLSSDLTSATDVWVDGLTSFNNNGFSLGSENPVNRAASNTFASFTFRKKSGFFDCVTYTGNSGTSQTIAHGLNGPVGMILVKAYSGAYSQNQNWMVFHAGNGATKYQVLNDGTAAATATSVWNDTAPTDTHFTVGSDGSVNNSGMTYVAYLFADNSSEDADDQMIKCGSYTGNSSTLQDINLGWEPQFLIVKNASAVAGWYMWDKMRGWFGGANNGDGHPLYANQASAEFNDDDVGLLSNGFQVADVLNTNTNSYIYMAIRAPMMKEPEAATNVFAIDTRGSSAATADGVVWHSGFPVDLAISKNVSGVSSPAAYDRSRMARSLFTDNDLAEQNQGGHKFDSMNGFDVRTLSASTIQLSWMWKRAKGFMDSVCYSGNGTAGRTVPHSLSVIPEMIWFKVRSNTSNWAVYHKGIGNTNYLELNTTLASTDGLIVNDTTPTESVFTLGNPSSVNWNTNTFIAYLFATLAGISKVGSFVGNGSSQTISCGFSAGSRFILIKRTDATGDWYFWDSVRGIVAGNDPHLSLNTTAAEVTTDDSVDPHNSGFIVNQNSTTNINVSSGTYIFYAIA